MTTITMNNTAVATFTTDQAEQLESILISMLDSGTITEEEGMALNECTNVRSLRITALHYGLVEEVVHLIKVLTGVYVNQPIAQADMTADLSEFFRCETPEEAKNL